MAFRFTIERKILLGFGSLIVLTFIAFGLTLITLTESKRINDKITNLYTPSVGVLEELNLLVIRSKMYISSWVNAPIESEDKEKLKLLIKKEYPELKERINSLANEWRNEDKEIIKTIFSLFDELTTAHQYIMGQLSTFESYREPVVFFEVKNMVEDADGKVNEKTRKILNNLTALINHQHKQAIQKNKEMLDSFELLQKIVITLGILLLIGGILIALFTARTIVRPVAEVKELLLRMARGILPDKKINEGTDEIGEMSLALNRLIGTMKLTTEFAREVGSGNFDSYYTPLSDEDALGLALIKMREDLRVNERMLEDKVALRTSEVLQQKAEIEIQSKKIEIFYKQVTDSIRYAKRIQEAILPPDNFVRKLMPDSFVLYKPKDIVSGDFYWFDQVADKIFFATVDCTGH
ncbi:MAG TPA: HAMP domain-containing protein, partial [Bacteroidia bacterium]|nr:HAMP domain-containing protein [Bacteroidia bacterium]